jgi:hypothetical protein
MTKMTKMTKMLIATSPFRYFLICFAKLSLLYVINFFQKICQDAGLPPGVLNVVPCSRNKVVEVGETLCTHRKVACLSFTGSTEVGKVIDLCLL